MRTGADYSVGVAARTAVGLGTYGSASVSIVSRVGAAAFSVAVAMGVDGPVARVSVDAPDAGARYHMFTMGEADPVQVTMPAAQHEFAVLLGNTYRIGVAAGNELGAGEYAYQDVLAVVVPEPPSFTLTPTYRKGAAHLLVDVSDPDPHIAHYLLRVGSEDTVPHESSEMLGGMYFPVTPGQAYVVSLAAGNVAGDSPYVKVTRATTVEEFEGLLEWRLILPGEMSPDVAVGTATRYVAIENGGPVPYDPIPGCMGREMARVQADLDRALSLYQWVNAMDVVPQGLAAYAGSHKLSTESALATAQVDAGTTCASRYPTVKNLGPDVARWDRVPR